MRELSSHGRAEHRFFFSHMNHFNSFSITTSTKQLIVTSKSRLECERRSRFCARQDPRAHEILKAARNTQAPWLLIQPPARAPFGLAGLRTVAVVADRPDERVVGHVGDYYSRAAVCGNRCGVRGEWQPRGAVCNITDTTTKVGPPPHISTYLRATIKQPRHAPAPRPDLVACARRPAAGARQRARVHHRVAHH